MQNLTVSLLVHRHRLSLAQINLLRWAEVNRNELIQEKVRALKQLKHIQKALDQIEESGIECTFFKGFVLSQRIYKDPSVRFSKDVDLMVKDREEVIRLGKFLFLKGWVPMEENWIEDLPRRDWYMNLVKHFSVFHPESGLVIEIHWELDRILLPLSEEEKLVFFQQNSEKMDVLNRQVIVLSPDLEFVFLLAHGSGSSWSRLKWLVDIYHYPLGILNVERVDLLLKKFKLESLPDFADNLLQYYFGKGLPFSCKKKAKPHLIFESKKRIEEDSWDSSLTLPQFLSGIRYNWILTKNQRGEAIKNLIRPIFLRTQDLTEFRLDAYWKYFFYRYYSLMRRKVFKKLHLSSQR